MNEEDLVRMQGVITDPGDDLAYGPEPRWWMAALRRDTAA